MDNQAGPFSWGIHSTNYFFLSTVKLGYNELGYNEQI